MRYSSNLDETYFKDTAVAGGQWPPWKEIATLAKEKLSACFSVLAEERDHYYPVDAFILDLNLTAATTLGASLANELIATVADQPPHLRRPARRNGRQRAGDARRSERGPRQRHASA